jgi:hypothetical protein
MILKPWRRTRQLTDSGARHWTYLVLRPNLTNRNYLHWLSRLWGGRREDDDSVGHAGVVSERDERGEGQPDWGECRGCQRMRVRCKLQVGRAAST